jgi:hypothetical protein
VTGPRWDIALSFFKVDCSSRVTRVFRGGMLSFRPPCLRSFSPSARSAPCGVAIERLAGDTELGTKFANIRAWLAHGGLSEAQLRRCHLERPSTVATAGAGRRETRSGPLDDEIAFELGERGEDAENQTAVCGRGVEVGALAGQHFCGGSGFLDSGIS